MQKYVIFLAITILFTACRTTKYVEDGQLLLDKVTIQGNTATVENTEINDYIRQSANARAFGFWRVNLHVYNLARPHDKRFANWLRRVGEAPVIYDSTLMKRSTDQIRLLFNNRGYFDCTVRDSMAITGKKKCHVFYIVDAKNPYYIGTLGYNVLQEDLQEIVYPDTVKSILHSGDIYDIYNHDLERERITRSLQERGYYSFGKDYCIFYADSTRLPHIVDDSLLVINPLNNAHKQAIIDSVDFHIAGNVKLRENVIQERCFLQPGLFFCLSDVENTQSRLHGLGLFGEVQIKFSNLATNDTIYDHLKCDINIRTNDLQSYSIEVEGTNSSGNFGAAAAVGYRHLNIFHHAEILDLKYRIATQYQAKNRTEESFFTLETGVEAGITVPKFLFPWVHPYKFNRKRNPNTRFSFSYDYQRRPDFTKSAFATKITYNWKTSEFVRHAFIPIEFNVVDIPTIADDFASYINKTYLRYSYTNHFIWSTNYTFLYNDPSWYVRSSAETAGNFLSIFGAKHVFGIDNAQYVKGDVEIRYNIQDRSKNSYVFRFYCGAGFPYNNSKALPFEKSFFVGGANSIRAWPVRALGPGFSCSDDETKYNNQTSDMRLEINAEYRFKIISILEGAVFADAGNIFSLTSHLKEENLSNILQKIAFGGGLGLRLNFNYFVLRLDAATKFYDPTVSTWVIGDDKYRWSDINWNFAIGYPF